MTAQQMRAVFGAVLALIGFVLIWGAIAPLTEPRDADGYYMSDPFTVDQPSHAIITGDIDFLRGRYETVSESSVVLAFVAEPDDIRMQAAASGPDTIFMGIAPTTAVDNYLDGVAHDEITDWTSDLASMRDIEYTTHEGTGIPDAPDTETSWATSVAGTGLQTLDWTIESGDWTAVIMNADASSGVMAELALGAAPSNIDTIAWSTLAIGLTALVGGGLLIFSAFRRRDSGLTTLPDDVPDGQTSVEVSAAQPPLGVGTER